MDVQAHAKINLTLDVGRLRSDGYHDVVMVMQSISLCDDLSLNFIEAGAPRLICDDLSLPMDGSNLVLRAAAAFGAATGCDLSGLELRLAKRIPAMAGLGGGSADAAAVLRGLNELVGAGSVEALQAIGLTVGSDVPFCVAGGAALAEGRGEILTPVDGLPDCGIVLVQPEFQVSTAALYGALDGTELAERPDTAGMLKALGQRDLPKVCGKLSNVFEQVLPPQERSVVDEVRSALLAQGALGARMTGTGSVVYGIFTTAAAAEKAAQTLDGKYPTVLTAVPV